MDRAVGMVPKLARVYLFFYLVLDAGVSHAIQSEPKMNKEVRTYLSFAQKIDPAEIVFITDMIFSYALGGTLVEWSASKEKVSGLTERMEKVDEQTFRFTLRKDLKWSDGSAVTSEQVKASFLRSLKKYPKALRSLGRVLKKIAVQVLGKLFFISMFPFIRVTFWGSLPSLIMGFSKLKTRRQGNLIFQ